MNEKQQNANAYQPRIQIEYLKDEIAIHAVSESMNSLIKALIDKNVLTRKTKKEKIEELTNLKKYIEEQEEDYK